MGPKTIVMITDYFVVWLTKYCPNKQFVAIYIVTITEKDCSLFPESNQKKVTEIRILDPRSLSLPTPNSDATHRLMVKFYYTRRPRPPTHVSHESERDSVDTVANFIA